MRNRGTPTATVAGCPEFQHRWFCIQQAVHHATLDRAPLAMDDPNPQDAASPACPQIFLDNAARLTRTEHMQVQYAINWVFHEITHGAGTHAGGRTCASALASEVFQCVEGAHRVIIAHIQPSPARSRESINHNDLYDILLLQEAYDVVPDQHIGR